MDKNRIEGKGKQAMGAAKDVVGRITGDKSTQIDGKVDKAAGKVQETYGRVKDEVRAEDHKQNEPRR